MLADVVEVVLRAVCVLTAFLVLPLLVGQTEHKVMAHMQGRLGPMYAGSFHGWAQLVADGVKFVQKEDSVPAAADRTVFKLAPGVALVPYLVALAAIPLAPGVVGADVDAGLLFVLAVSAVGVLGTLMGGWASGNKYSLLGGMRTAAQLLAYELPLVLAATSVAMAAGTLNLSAIAESWQWWWLLWQAPAALVFLVAGVAELQRPPFDMPIADAELVMGPVHRVRRPAVRVLPARRVRRDRRAGRAVHRPVPRRVGRPVRRGARLAVDARQGRAGLVRRDLDPGRVAAAARGPAAAARLGGAGAGRARPARADGGRGGGAVSEVEKGAGPLRGLARGLAVTLRTLGKPVVTAEYPEVAPLLPPRSRGVIALLEENCTVCMLCARECPDWCIYIDSHKETVVVEGAARDRQRNVLDRFAIDFSLCMYCGICIEVCPFDALFWSPQFEYSGTDIGDLTHERERLREWMWTVPPPPALDPAAPAAKETEAATRPARSARPERPARPARPSAGPPTPEDDA